jgi:uncharacterized protein (TIGR00251 family)
MPVLDPCLYVFIRVQNVYAVCGAQSRMDSDIPNLPPYLRSDADGVVLSVKVQPRASKNSIESNAGNELRIKVTAPPVDSAANEALVRYLSEILNIPRNRIEILRGHSSRHKIVKLFGISGVELLKRLNI